MSVTLKAVPHTGSVGRSSKPPITSLSPTYVAEPVLPWQGIYVTNKP